MEILFSLLLFVILFLLSRKLTSLIAFVFAQITGSNAVAIQLLAVLFFPGVVIHELAHWLIASILFVPTGEIEFLPRVQGNMVKLGSVGIGSTDPIRRFFIGVAPLFLGTIVLLGIFFYLNPSFFPFTWKAFIFLYVIFEIGNTMFSSKKDLEGVAIFTVLVFLLLSLLAFLKVPLIPFALALFASSTTATIAMQLIEFLLMAIGLDLGIIGVLILIARFYK